MRSIATPKSTTSTPSISKHPSIDELDHWKKTPYRATPTVEEPEPVREEGYTRPISAKPFYNDNSWNKSTHLPLSEYTTNLVDYYPRDEYTMMPIYKLKKTAPPENKIIPELPKLYEMDLVEGSEEGIYKSKLPADFIQKAIGPCEERKVVFKCLNIIDAQRRKHFVNDTGIAKPETALHLSDPSSGLYRAALVDARPLSYQPQTREQDKIGSDYEKYDSKGILRIMNGMNKPKIFPKITGQHYDLYKEEAVNVY